MSDQQQPTFDGELVELPKLPLGAVNFILTQLNAPNAVPAGGIMVLSDLIKRIANHVGPQVAALEAAAAAGATSATPPGEKTALAKAAGVVPTARRKR